MNKNDFIALLNQLPGDIDITIQTCRYDGTSDVYEDQEPRIIANEELAILTGERDIYAQFDAAYYHLSELSRTDIKSLLADPGPSVKVD